MSEEKNWNCFVSHRCTLQTHGFIHSISSIFNSHRIRFQVDLFDPGEAVLAKIKTFAYESLLFISTPESVTSYYCQQELEAAQNHSIPIFTVRLAGEVPDGLRLRINVDAREASPDQLTEPLHRLAAVMEDRSCVLALLQKLYGGSAAEAQREAARALMNRKDPSALGEFLPFLAIAYSPALDPLALFDLALAVGATRHPEARAMLENWKSQADHPYPQEGIARGIELLSLSS